ncbi:hypothetical protein RV134_200069 [Roseovarius sp. EC-HK134]|nr:hypothetical protein RV420_200017 [Roseovarius sp. EC-SD190]VVS99442.1 hypothetical protein RV134_200069 [Roseovarius sp. EC-HK134]
MFTRKRWVANSIESAGDFVPMHRDISQGWIIPGGVSRSHRPPLPFLDCCPHPPPERNGNH